MFLRIPTRGFGGRDKSKNHFDGRSKLTPRGGLLLEEGIDTHSPEALVETQDQHPQDNKKNLRQTPQGPQKRIA